MEWRCEWCGKPHEANDPPCDNCGHGRFEEAVVQMGPASTDDAVRPVWTCTECGRDHEKHSPPCSRCGNATLERRERDYSEVETAGSTGWLDVLDRTYAAGFAVVGVLALVVGLGLVGVVDLPFADTGGPAPPEVAGSSQTSDGGVPLPEAEAELVAAVNDDRDVALDRRDALDRMATYYNRRRVEAAQTDADRPQPDELDPFEADCDGDPLSLLPYRFARDDGDLDVDGAYETAPAMGRTLAESAGVRNDVTIAWFVGDQPDYERVGVDIYEGTSGDIFLTALAC